jgi:membrane-bound inhibitor of C-type lysozyme
MRNALIYCLAGLGAPALAVPLSLPDIQIDLRQVVQYRCDGGYALSVDYFNGDNGQSFAVLQIDGVKRLFVATLAASGVKYQADHYIWWSKGDSGNLYDQFLGEQAAPWHGNCTGGANGAPSRALSAPEKRRPIGDGSIAVP